MNTDYWHSMDRQFAKNTGLSPDFISMSTHPFKEQLEELKAKIFSGVKNVEISFIATGKSSRAQGQPNPEHYGHEERKELAELAQVNEVYLSVHSPANAGALSGLGQGGFSPELKNESLMELKRTIEFAADVARGGTITVHTQEFQRPIFEAFEGDKFEGYKGEKERAPLAYVDKRTGQIQGVSRDADILVPKGGFENPKRNEKGFIEWENKKVYELEKEAKEKKIDPMTYINDISFKKKIEIAEAEAENSASQAKKMEREFQYMKKFREELETQYRQDPEKAHDRAFEWMERVEPETRERLKPRPGTPEFKDYLKDPIKYVKEIEDRTQKSMAAAFESADSRKIEIEEAKKNLSNREPIKDYALRQTADSVSDAAIYALKLEKEKNLEKPLIICPENVFAQTFGSSPQELKVIINKSREAMVEKLVNNKLASSKEEANKIAEEHIKATFDIGHVNTWRQFFKEDDLNGKKFNKYILDEIGKLNKDKTIGHVHINDNFGYEDIHITPGQGNAPIKEFVDKITSKEGGGYQGKMVIEAGNQRGGEGWQTLPAAWKVLDSPIYKIDSVYGKWTDIEGSYFGKTGSPNYLVGDMAPSKEWTLWSEIPFE